MFVARSIVSIVSSWSQLVANLNNTHRVALRHQQFRQVRSILTSNTGDESDFTGHYIGDEWK
jgi:hypothetical protein